MLRVKVLILAQVLVWSAWSKAQDIPDPGAKQGTWGPWGEFSVCSRSCGVGVSYQERKCQSSAEDGPECSGEKRRYQTCNIQDCPEGSVDFRLEQCARFNDHDYRGKRYKWVPYIVGHEKCVLHCMPKGHNFYNRWSKTVVDGTKCGSDSYHICVNGKCELLGCDLILGSSAKEDKCGVCSGHGENCRTVTGSHQGKGDGYKEVAVIPAGSTNIEIKELNPGHSYLALMNSKGEYYLNGDYVISNPGSYKIRGSIFIYERNGNQERVFCKGPTTAPIHAMALLLGYASGSDISYEFSVPKSVPELPKKQQFSWKVGEFGKCSKTCAGGEQKRRVTCHRVRNGEEVADSNCDEKDEPSYRKKCNTQPCPARWYISGWSDCSVTCGRGRHVRRVHCEHTVIGGDSAMIPDDQCPGSKPFTMQSCDTNKECPVWSAGEWTTCSTTCGMGKKRRNVSCLIVQTSKVLPDESCFPSKKPDVTRECTPGPCTVRWSTSNWSECYPSCGQGMATRVVSCVSVSDESQKYPDQLCNLKTRPESRKSCHNDAECPPMWHASEWSRCTAKCGLGIQMRNIMCAHKEGEKLLRILPGQQCNPDTRMKAIQKCTVRPCQANWLIHRWSECSTSCGVGVRTRNVKCMADSQVDEEGKWCNQGNKPTTQEQCTSAPCKDSLPVTQESTSVGSTTPEAPTTVATTSPEEITTSTEEITTSPEEMTTSAEEITASTEEITTSPEEITTRAWEITEGKKPTTTAVEQNTRTTQLPSTEREIPTTTEQSTETELPTTIATTITRTTRLPSTTIEQSTASQLPPTTAEQSTETEILRTTGTELPTTVTQSVETELPTTTETGLTATAEPSTNTELPTTITQFLETELPTTTVKQFEETEFSTEQSTKTELLTTITETTEPQGPPTVTTQQSVDTELPRTTVRQTTEPQVPPIVTTEQYAHTELPRTTVRQTTELQVPPIVTTEQYAHTELPRTTVRQTTEPQQPTTADSATTTKETTETEASVTKTRQTMTRATTETSEQSTEPETELTQTTSEEPTQTPTEATENRSVPAVIHLAPTDTVAYAKTEVVFTCAATGFPKPAISWRKGSVPVSSLDPRYELLSDGSLRIKGVQLRDEATYTCIATTFVGPMDTKSAKLIVVVRPTVKVSRDTTVEEGSNVTISCRFSGKPYPKSQWFKDGELFNENSERITVDQTKLIIRQTTTSDSGKYSCQAAHAYDRAEDSMYLTVNKIEVTTAAPCQDNEALANCAIVKMVGLCCNPFYLQACCITCAPTC